MAPKLIGKRVKQRRTELGLSQKMLGRQINTTQGAIFKIERGAATRHLPALAKALGVSIDWLVYGEGEASSRCWPFEVSRLKDFESLPPDKRQELDIRLAGLITCALASDTSSTST